MSAPRGTRRSFLTTATAAGAAVRPAKPMSALKKLAAVGVLAFCLAGCHEAANDQATPAAIVGVWVVKMPEAPFPLHMFVFHSDGTVEQSNPEAGDLDSSDSNLMGVWRAVDDEYRGKLVEITTTRITRQIARIEISFRLKVRGNSLDGKATASFFDPDGRKTRGPIEARMEGERVLP